MRTSSPRSSSSRPSGAPGADKVSKSIVIAGDGQLAIDGKAIDLRAVRAHVEQLEAVESEAGIVVLADEDAPTGMVVAVADQVRLGGISDVTFTTTQLAEPQAR